MSDNPEQVKRNREARKTKARYSDSELKDVLATYSGRAVLLSILKECHIYAPIPNDPQQTFRELGRRDVSLWLRLKLLTIDTGSVILMENESRKRDEDLQL